MPIISPIGRRSASVRLALFAIYALLFVGALTMIYPLLLMLAGSTHSEADSGRVGPVPEFLLDDTVLWQKYVESKYILIPSAEAALNRSIGSWRNLTPPRPVDTTLLADFRALRDTFDFPAAWYWLGHTASEKLVAKNARRYRQFAQERYRGDLAVFCADVGVHYPAWSYVGPPLVQYAERRFTFADTPAYRLYDELKVASPRADWVIVNLDGVFRGSFLAPQWANVDAYNKAHDTRYANYAQVLLDTTPPTNPAQRRDWEAFVRNDLNVAFIRIDARFIIAPGDRADFIRNPDRCPLDALSIEGPRQAFERFVAARGGDTHRPIPMPVEQLDFADFQQQKTSLRREFVTRNYLAVWDFIASHGNGVRNTLVFCSLMVLTNLLVNPLAAYALSRFRPPATYTVLLFCMCTMAFPAEVTMVPSFLLLKRFPFYHLLVAAIVTIVLAIAFSRTKSRIPDWLKVAIILTAAFLAAWAVPALVGRPLPTISLLNTFWALILPAMANGFSIFLLKGFFDSLPQELYESAQLDGAGEWTQFWMIAMSLSKPILAVLALGAFTAAYSEFMMALVIIPDPSMWTMMVWLFQLQASAHPSVVYASLVIAAIPTLLVFLLCQNLILRGIVVPVEK